MDKITNTTAASEPRVDTHVVAISSVSYDLTLMIEVTSSVWQKKNLLRFSSHDRHEAQRNRQDWKIPSFLSPLHHQSFVKNPKKTPTSPSKKNKHKRTKQRRARKEKETKDDKSEKTTKKTTSLSLCGCWLIVSATADRTEFSWKVNDKRHNDKRELFRRSENKQGGTSLTPVFLPSLSLPHRPPFFCLIVLILTATQTQTTTENSPTRSVPPAYVPTISPYKSTPTDHIIPYLPCTTFFTRVWTKKKQRTHFFHFLVWPASLYLSRPKKIQRRCVCCFWSGCLPSGTYKQYNPTCLVIFLCVTEVQLAWPEERRGRGRGNSYCSYDNKKDKSK